MFGLINRSKLQNALQQIEDLQAQIADQKRWLSDCQTGRGELRRAKENLEHEVTVLAKTIVSLSDRNRMLQKQRDELLAYKEKQQRGLRNHKPVEMRVN